MCAESDRELLELAAKAAGIELLWRRGHPYRGANNVRQDEWTPLDDDGDALRLAANLRLDVVFAYDEVCVNWVSKTDCEYFEEPYGDDRMAATRRALVRAAAEIGRAMP